MTTEPTIMDSMESMALCIAYAAYLDDKRNPNIDFEEFKQQQKELEND